LNYNNATETEKVEARSCVQRLIEKNKKIRELEANMAGSHEQESVFGRVIKEKDVLFNIVMMIIVWTSSSFTFYLFNFLIKYMPGEVYFNSIVAGLSAAALIFQGQLGKTFWGAKGGMMISFCITFVSSVCLCFF
jgi:hypothetical protein